MASIHDCIDVAVQANQIGLTKAQAAKAVYDDLVARYEAVMPPAQARALARKDFGQATRRAARSRFHAVVNQLQTMRRITAALGTADRPDLVLESLVTYVEGSGYSGESIASLQGAFTDSINGRIAEFLRATGRRVTGSSRDQALLEDVIRELHLEDSGSQGAKDLAGAIRAEQKRLRQLFNAYGGDIGELADYGVRHTHDVVAIRKAGFDGWRAGIEDRLDWSRITDKTTGQPFVSQKGQKPAPAEAEAFLRVMYETITSLGWDRRWPKMQVQGKALYNRHAEARQLHFKSGSDWMAYNRDFGSGDPFTSAVGGLHGMGREIALMRVLGPNPNLGLEYAIQTAKKRTQELRAQGLKVRNLGGRKKPIEDMTNRAATRTRAMLAHADGSANTPAEGFETSAAIFGAVRHYTISTKLGSAVLSSVTDTATMEVAAQTVGMGGGRVLTRHVELMASKATRETAAQMGWVADTLATVGAAASRYLGDTYAPEVMSRLSDFTLRVSGLNFWTDMGRTAFKMEFAGLMAGNAGKVLDDVDAPLRKLLKERGITAADWDELRQHLFTAPNGAQFLSPHWFLEATALPRDQAEGLTMRLLAIIDEQTELAIPTVNLAGKVAFQGDVRPGTFMGELGRSAVMFKSFAMSLMINQLRRFWAQPGPLARTAYALKMSVSMLALGGLAVQLKELAKGRDPRPMDNRVFWASAALQGGGVGIFGDFFAASTSRFGGGFAQTLGGPVVGLASDVLKPIASNTNRLFEGKDLLLGRDIANFVRYNTPAASSVFYVRRAWDALAADQLQMLLDPEAEAAFSAAARRVQRDYGTSAWWDHGNVRPSRAPDFANAFGDTP